MVIRIINTLLVHCFDNGKGSYILYHFQNSRKATLYHEIRDHIYIYIYIFWNVDNYNLWMPRIVNVQNYRRLASLDNYVCFVGMFLQRYI